MKDTYLLYIDILGFGELANDQHRRARRLYQLLESLNVHQHYAFRTTVFSDTILTYSIEDPLLDHDHEYLVMFGIEFAQNLLYTTIGKGFYFRAILTYGGFEHSDSGRVERFFGPALVRAYQQEKAIGCTGLFIDNHCQRYNRTFEVAPWSNELYFVFLNRSLEQLNSGEFGTLPIPPDLLGDLDVQWHLAKDIRMLRDIHGLMQKHPDPRVRAKHLATWNFYYQRYPDLLHGLRSHDFDLSLISKGFDWRPAKRRIMEGYRGFSASVPSVTELRNIVRKARKAGQVAAQQALRQGRSGGVGGALIVLDVDGRSALGRMLLSDGVGEIPHFHVSRAQVFGGLVVHIGRLTNRQERRINEPAEAAALEVLKNELTVDGFLHSYWD